MDTTQTPLPGPSRDKLSTRWMDLFRVLAKTAPNSYRLDPPTSWRIFLEFNVERLHRYLCRLPALGGDDEPEEPAPVLDAGRLEHEV